MQIPETNIIGKIIIWISFCLWVSSPNYANGELVFQMQQSHVQWHV